MKKKLILLALAVILAGSYWLYSSGRKVETPRFKTEKVIRGDVTATVTASGTLSAVTTVKVGSQVSGIISRLYADFNSEVKRGQLLAELDPTTFMAQVDQRRADLRRNEVEHRNAKLAFERAKNLLEKELISQSEYDTAEANVLAAQAAVEQTMAALRQAETSLSYTKIVSPIDGVVVNKEYDIGQTVAASFQAPTLFTIAQDLTHMQVSTNVDESDIGRITEGQPASFTVDAYPDRTFDGKVSQVRLSPQVVQNVVTYPVLIDVQNPNLHLKPGMTANVSVPVDSRKHVLKIPNAALRFRPEPQDLNEKPAGGPTPKRSSVVYVLMETGKLKAIPVKATLTDGTFTAIEPGELREGQDIVVGLTTARAMESTGGVSTGRRMGR